MPDNKAIPAVEYLMSKDGGEVKRFILEGTDYVYPRTSNKIIRAFLNMKGVKDEDIMENYTPFGFADWQTEVAAIKKFGTAGKKTAVISTVNGDANVPFYKELANQGVKASDIPVIAFSVGEEELARIDTRPLVGHLTAWSYFHSVNKSVREAPGSTRSILLMLIVRRGWCLLVATIQVQNAITLFVQVVAVTLLPACLVFLMILLNDKPLMGQYVNTRCQRTS